MESHFTLPAESYSLTNGISQKQAPSLQALAGNNLWAVGHVADSTNQNLFYFDGIKGGECKWHKFQTPGLVAEEVQLELGFEGVLGLKMDQSLFLGSVESVQNSEISWAIISRNCKDFQIGREYICFRNTDSEMLHISQIEAPNESRPLPSISPPSCFCLTSSDDVICLIGSDLLILKSPYSHWSKVSVAAARPFFSLFATKIPILSKVLVMSGHLCGVSPDGQSISLLPLVNSPAWRQLSLSLQVREISAISGAQISFLLLDRHFTLHTAFLDSSNLRVTELPASVMPDSNTLLTSVRSIRSLFDKPDFIPFNSPTPVSATENFFTAGPSEYQMDFESAVPSAPADQPINFSADQSIEFSDSVSADQPIKFSADQPIEFSDSVSADQPIEFSDSVSADQPIEFSDSVSADQPIEFSDSVSADQPIEFSDSVSADIFLSPTDEPILNQSINDFSYQSNHASHPSDLFIDFPSVDANPSQSADWINSNPSQSADRINSNPSQSADWINSNPSQSADWINSNPSQSADWINSNPSQSADRINSSLVSSEIRGDVRTGTKRQMAPNTNSPLKFSKTTIDNSHCDIFRTSLFSDLIGRTSEERRTHKRLLRERADPCPLKECSFVPVRFDFSYFEDVVCDAETRLSSPTLLDRTEGVLFEQDFDFSAARQEDKHLSQIHPDTSLVTPPPSAPTTQQFLL